MSTVFQPPGPATIGASAGDKAFDLSPMLPAWARTDATAASADPGDFSVNAPAGINGHYPTLPLPPAGISAVAMIAAALAAKIALRLLRQRSQNIGGE